MRLFSILHHRKSSSNFPQPYCSRDSRVRASRLRPRSPKPTIARFIYFYNTAIKIRPERCRETQETSKWKFNKIGRKGKRNPRQIKVNSRRLDSENIATQNTFLLGPKLAHSSPERNNKVKSPRESLSINVLGPFSWWPFDQILVRFQCGPYVVELYHFHAFDHENENSVVY